MHLLGQLERPAFGDLQHRAEARDQVQTRHGDGHAAIGDEVRREAAAAEVFDDGRVPMRGLEARVGFGLGDFPERLHGGLAA